MKQYLLSNSKGEIVLSEQFEKGVYYYLFANTKIVKQQKIVVLGNN